MFGFGKVTCVLCDRRVPRRDGMSVSGHKGYAVCLDCVEEWQAKGGLCPRCQAPLSGRSHVGIFLEGRRSFGHAECGASELTAA